MNKLITSSEESDDLSINSDQDRGSRQRELSNSKNIKGKYHVRIIFEDVFGFAEHQEKATYYSGYKLTLTITKDDAALHKSVSLTDARIKIDRIHLYVPHYTPSIQQQGILSKQILSTTPTELRYFKRSVSMKDVNSQNVWTFEVGSQAEMNVPIWIIVGFQETDRHDSQNLNNYSFCRPPVSCAQGFVGLA